MKIKGKTYGGRSAQLAGGLENARARLAAKQKLLTAKAAKAAQAPAQAAETPKPKRVRAYDPRETCNECRRKVDEVVRASRHAGGSYNRAPRSYKCAVCVPCAEEMVKGQEALSFSRLVGPNRYVVGTLRHGLRERAERLALAPLTPATPTGETP